MSEFDRAKELRRYLIWLAVGLSFVIGAEFTQIRPGALFDRDGMKNAGQILGGLLQPNLSPDFLKRIVHLSFESLFVGLLGTVMAVLLGMSLALVAMRVPNLPDPPGKQRTWQNTGGNFIRWSARFLLGFFRSIPEIVWAFLFVRILGLGPGAAVFAIALTVGGSIGKLYSELGEAADSRVIGGMRAAGASRWGTILYGILPQVRRQWVAYALFRMECNIRTGTILGVVGAGGLGSEIALSIRYFEFDKLATALLAVLFFVIALEVVSSYMRRRHVKWPLAFGLMGGALSVYYLDIPWADLLSANLVGLGMPTTIGISMEYLLHVLYLVAQTVMMAWVATLLAAVFAFFLAPLSTSTLVTGSYLEGSYAKRGLARLGATATLMSSRLLLQIWRAMPELTLALIFVVWVGPGMFAGILAIAAHNVGVLGRLYTDVYEEVEPGPPRVLQASGSGSLGAWLFGVLPQVVPRLLAFTLYRFEVNVRATAMVGFVGAGGIGDALYTAISLFQIGDLISLLLIMVAVVTVVDYAGDRLRRRILNGPQQRADDFNLLGRLRGQEVGEQEQAHPPMPEGATVLIRVGHSMPYEPADILSVSYSSMSISCQDRCPCGVVFNVLVRDPITGDVLSTRGGVLRVHGRDAEAVCGHGLDLQFPANNARLSSALFAIAVRYGIPVRETAVLVGDRTARPPAAAPMPAPALLGGVSSYI